MKRLIVMVSPKSSTFAKVHFIDIRIGNICEMCAIAVQCVSFMWICFGWILRRRLVAGLHTFLQSRYIILWSRSMKTNIHKFEIWKSATMKINRAVRRKVSCFAVYIRETQINIRNLWYNVASGRSYLIQVPIFTLSGFFSCFTWPTRCPMMHVSSSWSCPATMIHPPRRNEALYQHTEYNYHGIDVN